jgi:hypothetical protein
MYLLPTELERACDELTEREDHTYANMFLEASTKPVKSSGKGPFDPLL